MDGVLEGASRLRPVLRVITNIISLKGDVSIVVKFLETIDIPTQPLTLLREILDKAKVKEQPWCQQILIDLVTIMHAYLASCFPSEDETKNNSLDAYMGTCLKFVELIPKLISQRIDVDLRLKEHTLLCLIYLCECMEKDEHNLADKFFSGIANIPGIVESIANNV